MNKSFDGAVSKHKNNLIESLSQFNEGHRVRGLLMDIESNKSDYRYYFKVGQQSKQAEVDELQKRIDVLSKKLNEMAHIFLDDLDDILKGNTNDH